jgi:hypothetical protein
LFLRGDLKADGWFKWGLEKYFAKSFKWGLESAVAPTPFFAYKPPFFKIQVGT